MNRKERRSAEKKNRTGGKRSGAVEQSVARAIAAIQGGNLEEGEAILSEVRRKEPGNVEAKHHLGMILARTGRADAGIALLREAVEANPREALYWNNLAASCLAVQRSAEAAEAAKKATELDPHYVMAWENLGFARRDLRQPDSAVAAFAEAARLRILDASTLRSWAACLLELGRYQAAAEKAREALAADPKAADALSTLGLALMQQARDDEARAALMQSLEINPENPAAAISYGRLLLRQPDGRDSGLRWLRRATSIVPRSAPAWRILAEALFRADLKEEAAAAIDRAAKLAPADSAIAALQGKIGGSTAAAPEPTAMPAPGLDDLVVSISTAMPAPQVAPAPAKPAGEGADPVFDLSVLKIGE
ncbi:MAG TPA: tetratricopeptide repeat protein [Dongiaceae bacterium]|nr:tetratricopeptide repeat protein [Dongiaceae bacterium]